jgi:hypothetical protein
MDGYFDDESIPPGLKNRNFGTIKSCPAVQDAINFGYTLYSPVDLYLDSTDPNSIAWYCPPVLTPGEDQEDLIKSFVDTIDSRSIDGYNIGAGFHDIMIKLSPLWGVRTDEGYSTWFTSPKHNDNHPFMVIDGIVDTDVFPARSPFAFKIRNGFKGVIKQGTPMLQAIPFKREDWSSEIVDSANQDNKEKEVALSRIFTNSYKKLFWHRKKFD